ncbi:MAG: FecR family protein [Litorivicinus sp.]
MRLLIPLVLMTSVAHAAEFIGVTAALRGDVQRVASETGQPLGPLTSGAQIFEGDQLAVGDEGRLQVMLLDQTTFTLGAGAEFTVDEFVMDSASPSLNADITRGAFRFVSGKIAKSGPDAMTVDVPNAVIGVRGTQVAGLVEEDGTAQVLLIGPGPNSFGATPGAIDISNELGNTTLQRGGYVVSTAANQSPSAPSQADNELIQRLEAAVQELGAEEIPAEIIEQFATEQTVELIEALAEAGVEGPDQATNNAAVLEVVLGTELAQELNEYGVGFTGEALYLLSQYADIQSLNQNPPPGPSKTELANSSLSGSFRYVANNVVMTVVGGSGSGSFDSITTLNFDANTVRSDVAGQVSALELANGTASFNFEFDQTAAFSALVDLNGDATFQTLAQDLDLSDGLTMTAPPTPTVNLGATNTFGGSVPTISGFQTTGTQTTDDQLAMSISGSFVDLNGDQANLHAVNVSVISSDDSITSGDKTVTNLGGTGVSVRTPE